MSFVPTRPCNCVLTPSAQPLPPGNRLVLTISNGSDNGTDALRQRKHIHTARIQRLTSHTHHTRSTVNNSRPAVNSPHSGSPRPKPKRETRNAASFTTVTSPSCSESTARTNVLNYPLASRCASRRIMATLTVPLLRWATSKSNSERSDR